jgi:hypothetical protein
MWTIALARNVAEKKRRLHHKCTLPVSELPAPSLRTCLSSRIHRTVDCAAPFLLYTECTADFTADKRSLHHGMHSRPSARTKLRGRESEGNGYGQDEKTRNRSLCRINQPTESRGACGSCFLDAREDAAFGVEAGMRDNQERFGPNLGRSWRLHAAAELRVAAGRTAACSADVTSPWVRGLSLASA